MANEYIYIFIETLFLNSGYSIFSGVCIYCRSNICHMSCRIAEKL